MKSYQASTAVLISFVLFFCTNAAHSQLPERPETLFSKNAIMFLSVPNAGEKLRQAKEHWYDLYFGEAVAAGHLKPLQLLTRGLKPRSILAKMYRTGERIDSHWLKTLSDLQQVSGNCIEELVDMLEGLEHRKSTEDDIVDSIASLFPGRFVFGLEPLNKKFAAVIAFEFDKEKFDWGEEFRKVHEKDSRNQCSSEGEVELYDIPGMGICFFVLNSSIFITFSDESERQKLLSELLSRIQDSKENLTDSRYFQRVIASFPESAIHQEIFGFVRYVSVFNRLELNAGGPTLGEAGIDLGFEDVFSSNTAGFLLEFGNQCRYRYTVTFPLIHPLAPKLKNYFDRFQDLDFDSPRLLANGPSTFVFSLPSEEKWRDRGHSLNARKQFSILEHHRDGKSKRSTVLFPEPQRFKASAPREECRIEVSRVSSKSRFFDTATDNTILLAPLLYGYQVDNSASEDIQASSFAHDASDLLESVEFKSSVDDLANFGVLQLPSIREKSKFPEREGEFRSLKSHAINDFEFHQFGDGRALLHVSSTADSTCVFNCSAYETDILFDQFSRSFSGQGAPLVLKDFFPQGIEGNLKLIGVERCLIGQSISREILAPIINLAEAANIDKQIDKEMPLMPFLRRISVQAIPVDFKTQSVLHRKQQIPLNFREEAMAVTVMSLSDSNKSVTYYGTVK